MATEMNTEQRTRRVVVSTFVSLDGVMQAPGEPEEDLAGGFVHGGWQMPYVDDAAMHVIGEGLAQTEGLLLGRRTYEIFAAHWPYQPEDDPLAATMNAFDKYVVSDSLREPAWARTRVIRGAELAARVTELRQGAGKDLRVIGSGALARALAAADLVDEYQLMIHPLVLGSGKRLFDAAGDRRDLELLSSYSTPAGVLIAHYRPVPTG